MTINEYESIFALCEEKYNKKTMEHAKRVEKYTMNDCRYCFYDKEDKWFLRALAIAHDLFEDTDVTPSILLRMNYNTQFITELAHLTRLDNEPYEKYIKQIVEIGGRPLLVKCADMKDHLTQRNTLTPRLKEKYSKVLKYLK